MNTLIKAYSVFLEPATGDWAWVKDADDESMCVGSCVTGGMEWMGDHAISVALVEMVNDWAKSFKPVWDSDANIDSFDWAAFNARGFAIAKQLKAEMGCDFEVRYVKAGEDPTRVRDEGFEILKNGNVLPKKLLWWCPV